MLQPLWGINFVLLQQQSQVLWACCLPGKWAAELQLSQGSQGGCCPGLPCQECLPVQHCHKNTAAVCWQMQDFYRVVPYASFKSISFINHDLLKLWRVFIYLAEFPSCCLLCRAVTLWKDGWSFHFVDFIFLSPRGISSFPCSSNLICISVQKF